MSRGSYGLGCLLEEMNRHKFRCKKAKKLGTIGKYVGNTTIYGGGIAYLLGYDLEMTAVCVISLLILILGIVCNVLLHEMAQKADEQAQRFS